MNEVMIGALSGVAAALIGAVLTAWLSYRFQDKLLDKQMALQKELMQEQHKFQTMLLEREMQEARHRDFVNRPNP